MLAAVVAASLTLATTAFGADPVAQFSWSPAQPRVGDQVTFTSTSSGDPESYAWDLDGDGQYDDATGPTAQRTYDQAGSKTVRLQVTKADKTSQVEHQFRVSSRLVSSFSWSPATPNQGETVTFTSTATVEGATFKDLSWDLNGDRKFNDAKGPTVTTTFAEAGDHQVGLRVTDSSGNRDTSFNTVSVSAPPPPPPPAPAPEPAPPAEPAPLGQQWLSPFPSVRIRGRATSGGVHISLFAVRAPVGSTLKVRCRGTRCPTKRVRTYTFETDRLRLRGMERFLTSSSKIEVFVWKSGLVGKYTSLTMRRAKPPVRSDRCLYPGGKWPGACPK